MMTNPHLSCLAGRTGQASGTGHHGTCPEAGHTDSGIVCKMAAYPFYLIHLKSHLSVGISFKIHSYSTLKNQDTT